MDDRLSTGRKGEALAAEYLSDRGYQILEQNLRTPYGEIDLVALHSGVAVFIEVKTRRSIKFGWPEEAVTRDKQDRIVASAQAYLMEHPDLAETWRVDVLAVQLHHGSEQASIRHFEHAIR